MILEVYRRHPAVVRSMVLADGYAGWRGSLGSREADARLAAVRAALAEPDDAFDPTLPGLFAGEPPALFVPLMEAMAADVRRHSMTTALTAMAQADLTEVLPTVQVATQLIWGALDARSPLSVAREFERRIPGSTLAVIPDCGHVSNLEAPDRSMSWFAASSTITAEACADKEARIGPLGQQVRRRFEPSAAKSARLCRWDSASPDPGSPAHDHTQREGRLTRGGESRDSAMRVLGWT